MDMGFDDYLQNLDDEIDDLPPESILTTRNLWYNPKGAGSVQSRMYRDATRKERERRSKEREAKNGREYVAS